MTKYDVNGVKYTYDEFTEMWVSPNGQYLTESQIEFTFHNEDDDDEAMEFNLMVSAMYDNGDPHLDVDFYYNY